MLSLNNIEVAYDRVFLAVKSISIDVPEGGLVALLGANGAGKSTTLKAISGLLRPERGEVTRGEIKFAGRDLLALDPPDRVRLGIATCLRAGGCLFISRRGKISLRRRPCTAIAGT